MNSICHFFYTHIIYGLFGFGSYQDTKRGRLRQAGNVFTMLFGAVGMVGVVGAASMTVMKGPVKTMSEVTKKTIAENNMIATTKLAMIVSSSNTATYDCDDDEILEPVEYGPDIPGFTGGGQIPPIIGTTSKDPWGTDYAYCSWDYGPSINQLGCTGDRRRRGGANSDQFVLAVISAGPDKVFSSSCIDYVDSTTSVVNKAPGTDDLVLGYTEADAYAMSGGLWTVKTGDPDTAEIQKKLEVTDGTAAQLQFDAASKTLTIGDGGTGSGLFPLVRADVIDDYNQDGSAISVMSPLTVTGNTNITGDTDVTGAISGASMNAGSGTIQTTGTIRGGNIRNSDDSGRITGAGAFVGTSLNAGSGTIQTDGTVIGDTIRNSANTGRITTAGALVGTSLNAGTGTIQTDGTVMGDLLRTSSNAGRIDNAGAITGTSLNVNGGNIQTSGNMSGGSATFSGPLAANGGITVDGNVVIDDGAGWHRTYGNTGWYNGTYGGGWHMSDSTWLRTYGGKAIYSDNLIRADGGFQVDGKQIISADGSQFFAQSSYGYFGADSNDMIRFDNGGAAYMQLNGTWEYYFNNSNFRPYSNNVNDLGVNGAHWRRVYAREICYGGTCTDVADLGTGGGGGNCFTTTLSWGGCSASVVGGPNGDVRGITDNACCSPPHCSSCHGQTGSATATCNNGNWQLSGTSCSSCYRSATSGCGDRDEAKEDLPWFGTSASKMKACFEGMLASGNLFDSSTPSSQNMSCSDIK